MSSRTHTVRGPAACVAALLVSHGLGSIEARGELAFQFTGTLLASGQGNDAFFFTVGSLDLLVTQLGEFNGTNETHTVSIYRTDATFAPLELVVAAQVTTTASYSGFQYVDVSASNAVLKANTKYFVNGNAGAGRQLVTNMTIGLGSGIKSFDAYRWNTSATPNAVTSQTSTSVYWGSNFDYVTAPTAAPAPGALAVIGGAIGLFGRRRR